MITALLSGRYSSEILSDFPVVEHAPIKRSNSRVINFMPLKHQYFLIVRINVCVLREIRENY